MCFSATASFSVATALTGVGVLSLALTKNKSYRALALVPLLFAIQQSAEGIVWLTLNKTSYLSLHYLAAYIFVIFAFVVWPLWLPLSLGLIEPAKIRRAIICLCGGVGIFIATSVIYAIVYYPMTITIVKGNLQYHSDFIGVFTGPGYVILYAIATILPFFTVKVRWATIFGLLAALSLLLSYHFKYTTLLSFWCYFVAILSIMVLYIIKFKQDYQA